MYLLNVHTRQLQEFIGDRIPPYAILSHTWGEDEVSFKDLWTPGHREKLGYKKIEGCCQQAILDGLEFVWVDTCCIDKRSSAELSEAINSMFKWYSEAEVCYVYLVDVSWEKDYDRGFSWEGGSEESRSAFRNSRWFTRGWTLQELIAPVYLKFFDSTWSMISRIQKYNWGSSETYSRIIEEVTGIRRWSEYALGKIRRKGGLRDVPVATKLSWASGRHTTRVEDMAYCLLGLLDINMPLLYGEGHKAFLRLQEEFLKKRHDPSILCWGFGMDYWEIRAINRDFDPGCLAPTPLLFRGFRDVALRKSYRAESTLRMGWTVTPHGLHIELPVVQVDTRNNVYLGMMDNHDEDTNKDLVIPLRKADSSDFYTRIHICGPFFLGWAGSLFKPQERLETIHLGNKFRPLDMRTAGGPIVDMTALYERGFILDSVYPFVSVLGNIMECLNKTTYFTSTHTIFVLHRKQRDTLCLRITRSKCPTRKLSYKTGQEAYKTTIFSCPYRNKRSAIEVWDACRRAWERGFQNPPQLNWQETAMINYENQAEYISSIWDFTVRPRGGFCVRGENSGH